MDHIRKAVSIEQQGGNPGDLNEGQVVYIIDGTVVNDIGDKNTQETVRKVPWLHYRKNREIVVVRIAILASIVTGGSAFVPVLAFGTALIAMNCGYKWLMGKERCTSSIWTSARGLRTAMNLVFRGKGKGGRRRRTRRKSTKKRRRKSTKKRRRRRTRKNKGGVTGGDFFSSLAELKHYLESHDQYQNGKITIDVRIPLPTPSVQRGEYHEADQESDDYIVLRIPNHEHISDGYHKKSYGLNWFSYLVQNDYLVNLSIVGGDTGPDAVVYPELQYKQSGGKKKGGKRRRTRKRRTRKRRTRKRS